MLAAVWRRERAPFLWAYGLSILCYSYLLTTPIFTNHTFPNVWLYPYPSFKTEFEGRWFADILIQLFGGSGVPAPQTALALAIQVANGLLLCRLLRIETGWQRFLVASIVALHPAILDYYSFAIDAIAFTTGDALALAGVLALDRIRDRRFGIPVAALAFMLAIAIYQPKIALIAFLLIVWCLGGLRAGTPPAAWPRIGIAATSFAAAILLYGGSLALTLGAGTGARNHVNGIADILAQAGWSYRVILSNFTEGVDYLPDVLRWLPAFCIVAGTLSLAVRSVRGRWSDAAALLLLLAAIAPALRLAYAINDETWENSGRILTAHAYLLATALAFAWSLPRIRHAVTAAAAAFVYFFAILAMQQTHAAVLRTTFDLAKADRILSRVEEIAPAGRAPLVVIGRLSMGLGRLVDRPARLYGVNTANDTFEPYRQVELLNFLAGREAFELPTAEIAAAATRSAATRPAWPDPASIWREGESVVVLLQPYVAGSTAVTTTR